MSWTKYCYLLIYFRSSLGSDSSGDVSSGDNSNTGKSYLRQIFNVVHSPFDNPKSEKPKTQDSTTSLKDATSQKDAIKDTKVIIPPPLDTIPKLPDVVTSKTTNSTVSKPVAISTAPKTPAPKVQTVTEIKPLAPPINNSSNHGFVCREKDMGPRVEQRSGNYWVFYNYVQAQKKYSCHETITYTTHGEYHFLHNLEPLLKRWMGPISVSIYTPGKRSNFQILNSS